MKEKEEEHDRRDEFTPEERERLRKLLISFERSVWLFGLVGAFSKWIAGFSAATIAVKMGLDWVRGVRP